MHDLGDEAVAAIRTIIKSYDALVSMNYKKARLEDIASQWDVIRHTMPKISDAMGACGSDDTSRSIRAHARRYAACYDFARELDTIAGLYAEDTDRLRAIGLKISESLEDKGLIALFGTVARG